LKIDGFRGRFRGICPTRRTKTTVIKWSEGQKIPLMEPNFIYVYIKRFWV